MRHKFIFNLAVCAAIAGTAWAQNHQRQAAMVSGGNPDRGKCTIEVFVDDVAEVEVRGTTATLRTLSGQPAQWRRFECNSAMPVNPVNFRFAGVDGRGRQDLIRDPRNGGVAVVRIEDKDGGSEGYTFDLFWGAVGNQGAYGNQGGNYRPGPPPSDNRGDDRYREYPDDRYRPGWRESDYNRRYGHGFASDEAVRVCQDSVAQQARSRFRNGDVHFGWTRVEDAPGREDWVIGSVDVHRFGRLERYRFSCSVNFDSGRIRTAQLETRPLQR